MTEKKPLICPLLMGHALVAATRAITEKTADNLTDAGMCQGDGCAWWVTSNKDDSNIGSCAVAYMGLHAILQSSLIADHRRAEKADTPPDARSRGY